VFLFEPLLSNPQTLLFEKEQLNKRAFNELGLGPKVLAKIKDLSVKDQGSVYSNILMRYALCVMSMPYALCVMKKDDYLAF
jgi:hypothetical protein